MPRFYISFLYSLLLVGLLSNLASSVFAGQSVERVSLDEFGVEALDRSLKPDLSADGDVVIFVSENSLMAIDTNSYDDVYAYIRSTDTLELISQDGLGNPGNSGSGSGATGWERPSISGDGNRVAFASGASNLVGGETGGIFVYYRDTDTIERVDKHTDGTSGNSRGQFPSFSADGNFVAFMSSASNLVDSDGNGVNDVFVHNLTTDVTERISVDKDGNEGNGQSKFIRLSGDGRYAAFSSWASNLIPSDTNGWDVFLYDRTDGSIERVSVDSSENEVSNSSGSSGVAISANGLFVAFNGGDLSPDGCDNEIFVRDIAAGTTDRACTFDGDVCHTNFCTFPDLSADGRYVVFESSAWNMTPLDSDSDSDIYVYDRQTQELIIASEDALGVNGDDRSEYPSISDDGLYVVFHSRSTNLVAGDTNAQTDIFVVYDLLFPTPTPTETQTLTHTVTWTLTSSSTLTLTPSHTPTYTKTETSTSTVTFTFTPTHTMSFTTTHTATHSPTHTPTATPSHTPTFTHTSTASHSHSPTYTESPTYTYTSTGTGTSTHSPTYTHTPTATRTATPSPTYTYTPTATGTFTPSSTYSYTPTVTPTTTPTGSSTISPTSTVSVTVSPTPTISSTYTRTPTLDYQSTDTSYSYPQPARGSEMHIVYNLVHEATVEIAIYDFSGATVRLLRSEGKAGGINRVRLGLVDMAPGVYYYLLRAKRISGEEVVLGPYKFVVIR